MSHIDIAGRVTPHDLDAEAAVLAAVLLSKEALDRVRPLLKSADFYSDANGEIYGAALKISEAGKPVDIVTVATWLRDRERLARVGGSSYLAQIADATPAVANVETHARAVEVKARLRRVLDAAHTVAAEAYGNVGDPEAWLADAGERLRLAGEASADAHAAPTLGETMVEVFRDISNPNADPGLLTGIGRLDRRLGPMRRGNLVIIAAASGAGKTALGTCMAMAVARKAPPAPAEGAPEPRWPAVLVFSHEMTRHELALRIAFTEARRDVSRLNAGRMTALDWQELTGAARAVDLDNVYFDDRSGLGPTQLRARALSVRRQAERDGYKLALVVVDYLQLVDGGNPGKRGERRDQEISNVTKALKSLAKELGCVVLLLAQVNDDAHREKRRPRKEDLRECKGAAADADKIILLHNPAGVARRHELADDANAEAYAGAEPVELIVDKNRGGKEGIVHASFFPTYTMFADMTDEEHERVLCEKRAAAASAGKGGR